MVNTKAIYVAGGGIAAIAIAIFFILGSGNFRLPGGQDNNQGTAATQNQTTQANLGFTIKNITAERTDDRNADVHISFDVLNPNTSTVLLETIHYTIYVDKFTMTSGDIGVSPEGFVAGQADTFPIVSGSNVTLRDTESAERNNLTASSWDSMVEGTAQYRVEGMYSFRLTGANFQTTFQEHEFNMTFP